MDSDKKLWVVAAHGVFERKEINDMERRMCDYLDWEFNIEPDDLKEFEFTIRKYFPTHKPYPTDVFHNIEEVAATPHNHFPIARTRHASPLTNELPLPAPAQDPNSLVINANNTTANARADTELQERRYMQAEPSIW